MTPEFLVFLVLAFIAVVAAVGMILSRNAIYAALFLVLVMASLAVVYLLLNAPFLAAVQVSVYAGAIMVLFIFVIMLLGAEKLNPAETLPAFQWQRPLAIGLGALLALQTAYVIFTRSAASSAMGSVIDSSPLAIGKILFGPYLLPFEAASILLLAAMVGAVVMTRKE
ncbi:MAG TPA: NADH-quinone oxidoreductase subunit J [Thermoflexales bacterium]|nr:NADH-quinone oxidoreductase subunit J [Thermoflexales bacterium]HQW36820.1 NADH-quinone oxidoreductase subunit J [Thermoflexales bacterium]HQZ21968.1 NADH-quinone oxidoreductase subunit J [Thermoflexales bacterium]HQZ99225.1 NADH-quinone oxidoreductase subunit J [Thermoflexales bacterium]